MPKSNNNKRHRLHLSGDTPRGVVHNTRQVGLVSFEGAGYGFKMEVILI